MPVLGAISPMCSDSGRVAPGRDNIMPTVVKRRMAAFNSKWNVYLDHLADAHGNEVQDYLVVEGKLQRPDQVTGVCILPVMGDRIVLIQCYRHALRSQLWEAVKGFVDVGETLAQAAARELAEETGLSCAPAGLVPLGLMAPEASTLRGRAALFAATRCTGELRIGVGEIGLGRVSLFNAAASVNLEATGGIEDASTLIAIYRYRAMAATALA